MELVWPASAYLDRFRDALVRGWSPDSQRGDDGARDELETLDADPGQYLAAQVDREALGPPIKLADGSFAERLPGYRRWMWDGDFCGIVGLRWQRGSTELPPHCLGHIGYSVVPWKRRRGYATAALGLMLRHAKDEGLPFVIVTTDPANVASQRVIEVNGGVLLDTFVKPAAQGGAMGLRYRIDLDRIEPCSASA